jgi:NADPH:quinone reductase-like Zn-dependent oxidoreductase
MRAAAIDRFGAPGQLKIHTLPVPTPGAHEVLIELHSAGVGVWDGEIRKGRYAEGNEEFPMVLGVDGAGVVVARGKSVRRLSIDEPVWSYSYGDAKEGFYAEYVAVKADHVARAPRALSLLEAGASAATGLTAVQGVDDHLKVRRGETNLVFGATGAVGTLAVQFARRHGAHVIATASGEGEAKTMRNLGAEHVLDARASGAPERLRSFAPKGLNGILAFASGDVLEQCVDQLLDNGRLVHPNGVTPEIKKRENLRPISYDALVGPDEMDRLSRAITAAKLRVVIADSFPLEEAAKAHERLEKGHILGRIAIKIR